MLPRCVTVHLEGTLLGMTRFRDVLDDMPILGYGRGALAHDRLYSFHNTLAGHSLNYISRGTFWGTEQRAQLDYSVGNRTGILNKRWRNACGVGGEDCSLCMVSGIASAYVGKAFFRCAVLVAQSLEGPATASVDARSFLMQMASSSVATDDVIFFQVLGPMDVTLRKC